MKTKILADFQICISVPLIKVRGELQNLIPSNLIASNKGGWFYTSYTLQSVFILIKVK